MDSDALTNEQNLIQTIKKALHATITANEQLRRQLMKLLHDKELAKGEMERKDAAIIQLANMVNDLSNNALAAWTNNK